MSRWGIGAGLISTHPVVDQRVNAPAELAQLGVDAVEDGVLQVEDAVRKHGTVSLGRSWAAASAVVMLRPPGALAQGTAQGSRVSGGRPDEGAHRCPL